MSRLKAWNNWRKRNSNSVLHKILVLFGLVVSPTFELYLSTYGMPEIGAHNPVRLFKPKGTVRFKDGHMEEIISYNKHSGHHCIFTTESGTYELIDTFVLNIDDVGWPNDIRYPYPPSDRFVFGKLTSENNGTKYWEFVEDIELVELEGGDAE